jgi:hypothetical protein
MRQIYSTLHYWARVKSYMIVIDCGMRMREWENNTHYSSRTEEGKKMEEG